MNKAKEFPAPTEVDRELYDWITMNKEISDRFPAPFEVDRFLYECTYFINDMGGWFPAPREVDREIYQMVLCYQSRPPKVSGPYRGE